MKAITVHARESFLIKKTNLPHAVRDELTRNFTFYFFEEKACASCDIKPERLKSEDKITPTCEECAAFNGGARLANEVKIGSTVYFKTPIGNKTTLTKVLEKHNIRYKVKRHHPTTEMARKIQFIGSYRAKYQEEAVEALINKKRGVLKSPPRSGKTVMISAAICKLGLKTMIMASQREWLLGFLETFIGSDTQPALTNCKKSQIGIAKTYEDFLKYDICLVTVQTFYKKPRLLRKVRDLFSVLAIDEVHTSAANEYAKVINQLNVQYLWGASGTPQRKDRKDAIMRQLVGRDIYEAKVPRLRPRVFLTKTDYAGKKSRMWTQMVSSLEKDPKRLKLIAETALKDVKNGHLVLIPFSQVTPIKALVKAINILAGKEIARPFYGGLKKPERDRNIQDARTYKIKVLVGNIQLLSTGTNIPRASMLYEVTMRSNLPAAEQRFSRVLTPYEDKPTPGVRYFLDDFDIRRTCMKTEFWGMLHKQFNPIISDKDMTILKQYFANTKRNSYQKVEW